MLSFLHKYASPGRYSQNGEHGILVEALRRMGIEKGHCVEIGANDGYYCSNTAELIEHGWTGTYVEADYSLYKKCVQNWSFTNQVKSQCARVDGNNINAFVDDRCDVLSIDTDGQDYKIFAGLRIRPKIVIIEIDSSIEPPSEDLNSDGAAGYYTTVGLALNRGYFLLAHTGNLVLVADEYTNLFSEVWGSHPLKDWPLYFNRSWMKENAA